MTINKKNENIISFLFRKNLFPCKNFKINNDIGIAKPFCLAKHATTNPKNIIFFCECEIPCKHKILPTKKIRSLIIRGFDK